MKHARLESIVSFIPRASVVLGSLGLAALLATGAMAQDQKAPAKDTAKPWDSYTIHQSFDVGGHLDSLNGSRPMYDTLVNLQSGPRILNQTLEMHAAPGSKHSVFDNLFEDSTGYGGDPNSFSTLRASKGKAYDFVGMFRRDRQYFDYDLWGNPLVPGGAAAPISNGYTFPQILDSPHFFNTVRRNTDLNFTFLPVSLVSFRAGWNLNEMEGPTGSSLHQGADAMLLQNWRNTTETWVGAIDWKPVQRTTLTYEQHITAYKGDTFWSLAGLNMQLPNGTPVTIGFDNDGGVGATSASSGCGAHPAVLDSTTNPPTANPCVNSYTSYSRTQPTRTLFPTEEFRFQSAAIKNLEMTGRILYTGAQMKLNDYNESFTGMESRVTTVIATGPASAPPPAGGYCTKSTKNGVTTYSDCHTQMAITGFARAQRIDVGADYGAVLQVSRMFTVSEQFDFQNWRQPGIGSLSEVDGFAASTISPVAVTLPPVVTAPVNSLAQKMATNTLMGEWEASDWLQLGIGYRYRTRTLNVQRSIATEAVSDPSLLSYSQKIDENAVILDAAMRPIREWRINGSVETGWEDAAYVQTDPRQFQHFQIHTTYKPRPWASISAAYNDTERRNNVTLVNFKAHNRAGSGTVSLAPNELLSFEASYGYIDVFSTGVDCFDAAVQPSGATALPVGVACGNASNAANAAPAAWYGNSLYDAPTQYGSVAVVWTPVKQFRGGAGYRTNDVKGYTQLLNPNAVPGTLRSSYQTPFANLAYTFTPAWTMKADYGYYGYVEDSAVGPTAPRNFHSHLYTLGMHYQF